MPTVTLDDRPNKVAQSARRDLLFKLMARALDPETQIGEAENAATRFVHVARREGFGIEDIGAVFGQAEPDACSIVMPQGKHAGFTLGMIARLDFEYLAWMAQEFNDPDLRDAAAVVLERFTQGRESR